MLDVSTQAALLEAIAAEQGERDLAVQLITHDRILAAHWCEQTADIGDLSRRGEVAESKAVYS